MHGVLAALMVSVKHLTFGGPDSQRQVACRICYGADSACHSCLSALHGPFVLELFHWKCYCSASHTKVWSEVPTIKMHKVLTSRDSSKESLERLASRWTTICLSRILCILIASYRPQDLMRDRWPMPASVRFLTCISFEENISSYLAFR